MPVYKKSPGKWRVRVWSEGRRRDWIVEGSKADAEAFEARKRLAAPAPVEIRAVPTLSHFCATHYRTHAKKHLKPSTWRNRRYQLASLLEHLGGLRLDKITPVEVDAYTTARTEAGCRPSTVNDDLKVLAAVLNYARGLGLPLAPPKLKGLPTRGARRHAAPWAADEVSRLISACPSALRPVVLFLANTGARKGEALALEIRNVDLERGIVRIWASEEWQPKDGDNREVPISDALRPTLEAAVARGGRWAFPVKRGRTKGERYAFWPQNTFDAAVARAGLTGGPHRLRHTFASHFLDATGDLYMLGRILGHSHARVTELYGHLVPGALVKVRNAVEFGYGAGTVLPANPPKPDLSSVISDEETPT